MSYRSAPYPADTRAKGWRFELNYERIEQSDTWALASTELRPWLLMLWFTAWKQVPSGSLPDCDELIAARVGIASKAFTKNRAILLRGWWKAEDGRLYHDVIAEQVIGMLKTKRIETERKASYRARKAELDAQSQGNSGTPRTGDSVPQVSHGCPTGQTWESHGCPPGVTLPEPEPEPIKEERGFQAAPGNLPLGDSKKKANTAKLVTFTVWAEQIKAAGEKAISEYKLVWSYAEKAGIPPDWINLAWILFKKRYSTDPSYLEKKYTDWRRHFLNTVEQNYFKLWFVKDDQFILTTQGHQAELVTREVA